MKAIPIDQSKIRIADGAEWAVFEETPEYRRSSILLEDGNIAIRTEYLQDDALIEQNRQRYEESLSQRFGDGKVVASVPMHIWSREIAPRLREGDLDFSKWFLNQEKNRHWRTFRGKI